MRRYIVSKGVERSLRFKGLAGVWILTFVLGQVFFLVLAVIGILLGLSALWSLGLLTLLAGVWTFFCYKMSRRFPYGGLERLMGLKMMPRCLERRHPLFEGALKQEASETQVRYATDR